MNSDLFAIGDAGQRVWIPVNLMSEYFDEAEFERSMSTTTLIRIAKLARRHWGLAFGSLGGILLVSLIEAYFTFLTKRVIDEGVVAGDYDQLVAVSIQYALWWIPFAVLVFAFIVCTGYLGQNVKYDLRKMMFDHLQKLELAYYDRTPTGWLQARVTSDAERVGDLVAWGFLDMTWAVGAVSMSLLFMFRINWQLAIVVALLVPILALIANWFQFRILDAFRISRRTNSKITGSYSEMISGVRVVKSLGREQTNQGKFENLTGEMYGASFRAAWMSALFLPIVQFITATGIGVIIWVGGWQVQLGGMTVGGIQAFVGYITFMLWPIQQLAMVYASMQQAIASAERIFGLLDTDPAIVNLPGAQAAATLDGDIVFDNVSFYYEADKPVLRDFSLRVREGETIALVGPTGAGKSTVVNLVGRFYEPTSGRILMKGRDYRDLTLHTIQSRLGMVLQTPYLFSGSIMDNIRYGRLDASDREVLDAAIMAGADPFIHNLEDGYETQVGEEGVLLSVGQKQLLSLARAILADPTILIMDEATSSVDTLTEALIQSAMERLMEGRTSFVIAHRLSTIKNADRILVLKDGEIDELGTHAELIRAQGHYYDLYTKQFRRERQAEIDWSALPVGA